MVCATAVFGKRKRIGLQHLNLRNPLLSPSQTRGSADSCRQMTSAPAQESQRMRVSV